MTGKATGAAKGSPLRQRMIEQMRIANLAESTQTAYLFEVERLARHYRTSPAACCVAAGLALRRPVGRLAAAGAVAPRAPLGIASAVGLPMRFRVALTPLVPGRRARAAIGRSAIHGGRACLAEAGGPAFGPARAFRGPPVVAAGLAHRPAFLGRDIAAADAEAGGPALGTTATAALAVGEARGFGVAPRLALRPRPGVTGAVGGETPFGARLALGTLRERRHPAALDAEARGLALGVLAAAALAVAGSGGFGSSPRLMRSMAAAASRRRSSTVLSPAGPSVARFRPAGPLDWTM